MKVLMTIIATASGVGFLQSPPQPVRQRALQNSEDTGPQVQSATISLPVKKVTLEGEKENADNTDATTTKLDLKTSAKNQLAALEQSRKSSTENSSNEFCGFSSASLLTIWNEAAQGTSESNQERRAMETKLQMSISMNRYAKACWTTLKADPLFHTNLLYSVKFALQKTGRSSDWFAAVVGGTDASGIDCGSERSRLLQSSFTLASHAGICHCGCKPEFPARGRRYRTDRVKDKLQTDDFRKELVAQMNTRSAAGDRSRGSVASYSVVGNVYRVQSEVEREQLTVYDVRAFEITAFENTSLASLENSDAVSSGVATSGVSSTTTLQSDAASSAASSSSTVLSKPAVDAAKSSSSTTSVTSAVLGLVMLTLL